MAVVLMTMNIKSRSQDFQRVLQITLRYRPLDIGEKTNIQFMAYKINIKSCAIIQIYLS